MTGKPNSDPPQKAHDSNQLGGEEPPYYAAAAALDALDADLTDHAGSTSGVHGVDGTDTVAGQSDVDAVTSDLNDHEAATSGVHGANGEVFGSLDYTPESDVHNRYTDSEAAAAAPVQSVNGNTGNVSVAVDSTRISAGYRTFLSDGQSSSLTVKDYPLSEQFEPVDTEYLAGSFTNNSFDSSSMDYTAEYLHNGTVIETVTGTVTQGETDSWEIPITPQLIDEVSIDAVETTNDNDRNCGSEMEGEILPLPGHGHTTS